MRLKKQPNENDKSIINRESGYYCAKLSEKSIPEIIYWTGKVWQRMGIVNTFNDESFFEIGERIF